MGDKTKPESIDDLDPTAQGDHLRHSIKEGLIKRMPHGSAESPETEGRHTQHVLGRMRADKLGGRGQ